MCESECICITLEILCGRTSDTLRYLHCTLFTYVRLKMNKAVSVKGTYITIITRWTEFMYIMPVRNRPS